MKLKREIFNDQTQIKRTEMTTQHPIKGNIQKSIQVQRFDDEDVIYYLHEENELSPPSSKQSLTKLFSFCNPSLAWCS